MLYMPASLGWLLHGAVPSMPQGRITVREYHVGGANKLQRLTDYPGYPEAADATYYPMHFEWPTGPDGLDQDSTQNPPDDVRDDYGWEMRGYYHPERTGDHFFAIASDDAGELWLSSDDSFDNLELIATEPAWNASRAFGTEARRTYVDRGRPYERLQNWSKAQSLTQGKAYAILARAVEGAGGDHLAVAHNDVMQFEDDMEPIPGRFLSTFDRQSLQETYLRSVVGDADRIEIVLVDGEGEQAALVETSQVMVWLDGTGVQPTFRRSGRETTFVYALESDFMAPGSHHELRVQWRDSQGGSKEAVRPIAVADYVVVPASLAQHDSLTSPRGFLFRMLQSEAVLDNDIQIREAHLMGSLGGENIANTITKREDTWTVPSVNFSLKGDPQGWFHSRGDGLSHDTADSLFPGIPGKTGSTDNMTGELHALVRIPKAGLYVFGVHSDDGFETTLGLDAANRIRLGRFNAGRLAESTLFRVLFEEPGDYPMRTVWFQGSGEASLEWFTLYPNLALLNDTEQGGLATFAMKPRLPAWVHALSPGPGSTALPDEGIDLELEDPSSLLDLDSIQLSLNGEAAELAIERLGAITSVKVNRQDALWQAGQQMKVDLRYQAGDFDREVSWEFKVAPHGGRIADQVGGHPGLLLGDATLSQGGGGRTGQPDDVALDLTGKEGTLLVRDAGFMAQAFAQDQVSFLFWQKKYHLQDSSAIWITSPSASAGQRAFQAHIPWGNHRVYFDTQGCCEPGSQRLSGHIPELPAEEGPFWGSWHLWALIKDKGLKQVYVDGQLLLEGFGADPLSDDMGELWLGSQQGVSNFDRSLFDDLIIVDRAMKASEMRSLQEGSRIEDLDGLLAWWDFNPSQGSVISPWHAGDVLALNFASEHPLGTGSAVEGKAGVIGTQHWNNLVGSPGAVSELVIQSETGPVVRPVSVSWSAARSQSVSLSALSENGVQSGDIHLMSGYIDTTPAASYQVLVRGLPTDLGYDLIVYTQGGLIGASSQFLIGERSLSHVSSNRFSGEFKHGKTGNYLVFQGLMGDIVDLTAVPDRFVAPIHGLEIVLGGGVPLPEEPQPENPNQSVQVIAIQRDAGRIMLEYSGQLKRATQLSGPYETVPGASSPYEVLLESIQAFYIVD